MKKFLLIFKNILLGLGFWFTLLATVFYMLQLYDSDIQLIFKVVMAPAAATNCFVLCKFLWDLNRKLKFMAAIALKRERATGLL
jgi:hypothetical protein